MFVSLRKGLGKNGEGRVEPVEIVILPNGSCEHNLAVFIFDNYKAYPLMLVLS